MLRAEASELESSLRCIQLLDASEQSPKSGKELFASSKRRLSI